MNQNPAGNSTSSGIIFSLFLATLGIAAFTFSFPLLAAEKSLGGLWVGSAFSSYFLARLFVAPLAGSLADRIGIRRILVITTSIGVFLPWLYLLSPSATILYCIQFCLGLVGGIIRPLGMAALGGQPENKISSFSGLNLAFNGAFIAGPLVAGTLHLIGPSVFPLLFFLSLSQLLSALLLANFLGKSHERQGKNNSITDFWQAFKKLLPLFIAVVGRTAGIGIIISFYPLLLSETLIGSRLLLAIFFIIPNLATISTLLVTKYWLTPTNQERAAVIGMLISACGLLLLFFFPHAQGFILGSLVIGLGSGISAPATMAMATSHPGLRASNAGIFYTGANLGFVLGPISAGALIWQNGSLISAFWLGGMLGILCCAPLVLQQLRKSWSWSVPTPVARLLVFAVCLILAFTVLLSRENHRAASQFKYANIAMGTIVRLTLAHGNEAEANAAAKDAFARIRLWQEDLDHRFLNGSIGRVNEAAGREPVIVSELAANLLLRALDFCKKSKGVFDISIGAITRQPGYFHETIAREKHELVDYRLIELDFPQKKVFLPRQGMALDLGGLAKGTVIDGAVAKLQSQGIKTGIVEAGGDFSCFGDKKWRCGIQHPRENRLLGIIDLKNRAMCGSGDYHQFILLEEGEKSTRKHHIIDIKAADSASKSISVTTLAKTAELADALATTLLIMGPEEGRNFLQIHYPDADALWVLPDLRVVTTANFPPLQQP